MIIHFIYKSARVQNNRIHHALDAPTSCLDALEISLLFCYLYSCYCLLKAMCPLKSALKMGAHQISYFATWNQQSTSFANRFWELGKVIAW